MITKCVSCHHEAQTVENTEPCDWCGEPMQSIGSDYMSDCDGSTCFSSEVSDGSVQGITGR